MQSAREPGPGRAMAATAPRTPATNRTLMWFSADAERRRRAAAAAQEELSRRTVAELGRIRFSDRSYDEIRWHAHALRAAYLTAVVRNLVARLTALPRRSAVAAASGVAGGVVASGTTVWHRPALFGCVALAALGLAIAGPALNAAGMRPCRTAPPVLTSGPDLDVRMMVSRNAACAIWAKADSISIDDMTITLTPQHGTLAPRGRTGVTYRPSHGFIGDDLFALALRKKPGGPDETSLVKVRVTVK